MLAGGIDLGQPHRLRGRHVVLAQQMDEAGDGVERGADLVAHVGQERAFCAVRAFRLLLRQIELGGALLDASVELRIQLFKLRGALFCAADGPRQGLLPFPEQLFAPSGGDDQ